MTKQIKATSFLVALSILLSGCGDWCKSKSASGTTSNAQVPATSAAAGEVHAGNVVFFEFDSSKVSEDGKKVISEHKSKMTKETVVTGHCSEEGSESYNYGLSERRANAVAEEAKTQGATDKPNVISYGKSADFGAGLEKNRRAIIHADGKVTGVDGKAATASSKKSKKSRVSKVKVLKTKAEAEKAMKAPEATAPATTPAASTAPVTTTAPAVATAAPTVA